MEDQLGAGEESDDEGESTRNTSNTPAAPVPSFDLSFLSLDWLQCAFLEASNCQVESQYLSVLRQLQETKSLDPDQREAVQKMVEDALKRELKSVVKLRMAR